MYNSKEQFNSTMKSAVNVLYQNRLDDDDYNDALSSFELKMRCGGAGAVVAVEEFIDNFNEQNPRMSLDICGLNYGFNYAVLVISMYAYDANSQVVMNYDVDVDNLYEMEITHRN